MAQGELTREGETPFIDLIKDTWEPFTVNWKITIGSAAILSYVPMLAVGIPACIVAFVVAFLAALVNKELVMVFLFPVGIIAGLAFAAAYNALRAGWTKMLLRICHGQEVQFSELKSGMPYFLNFFLTLLIIGVATTIGSLLLIIPGIFIAIRTSLAPYLVVDENLGPIEAIMKSNEMVSGYSWQILGYYAIMGFANIVFGIVPMAPIILVPVSMAFFDLALARIYLYRKHNCNPTSLFSPTMAP